MVIASILFSRRFSRGLSRGFSRLFLRLFCRLFSFLISYLFSYLFSFSGRFSCLLIVSLTSSFALTAPERIKLSAEDVAKQALNQSSLAFETNATSELGRLTWAKAIAAYDLALATELGFEKSKVQSSFASSSDQDETTKWTLSLTKSFTTGTQTSLDYTHSSLRSDLYATAAATARSQTESRLIGITLTQNLWKNYFGKADRHDIEAADKALESTRLTRIDNLESVVLTALKAYWKAAVAQETFQEALNSRERYQKLVEAVKKKNAYGYANPGELSQVQAEYEAREASVKTASADFLASLDELNTLLGLPPQTILEFEIKKNVTAPTLLTPVKLEELRSIRSARLKKEAASASLVATRSKDKPDLSLVAKVYTSGFDESSATANSEMLSGTNPKTYLGIKYQTPIGSSLYNEDILNKKLTRDIEVSKYDRLLRETSDTLSRLERNVQATYNTSVSLKNQQALREKVVSELNRTFSQGRTDISTLIEALNKYFGVELALVKSVGDYQIALNELAAARDELIKESDAKSVNLQNPNGPDKEEP